MNEREGVDRFSIVTAGKALTGEEFDKAIHAYETMNRECKIDLCASMGFLFSGAASQTARGRCQQLSPQYRDLKA